MAKKRLTVYFLLKKESENYVRGFMKHFFLYLFKFFRETAQDK